MEYWEEQADLENNEAEIRLKREPRITMRPETYIEARGIQGQTVEEILLEMFDSELKKFGHASNMSFDEYLEMIEYVHDKTFGSGSFYAFY